MFNLRQILPQEVCLACDVCCRFLEPESAWRPAFAEEEKKRIDKNLPLDKSGKVSLIKYKQMYICPCYAPESNKCKVYSLRPLDCQLYPFLLIKKGSQIYLGIDKKCPYTKVIFEEEAKQAFLDYLKKELTSKDVAAWLKKNPNLFGTYDEEALEIAYLFDL
jgi:Fe-S-cluster containining protein